MDPNKRFLILTNDSGFGHRSAANSVVKALKILHPMSVTASVINPILDRPAPALLRKTEIDYDHTVRFNQGWYRFTYEISDSRRASSLVESTLTLALNKNMRHLLSEINPDAILNTNQLFNAPMGAALNDLKRQIPFFTVVTDLADVHSLWFNSSPDRFYVASEFVKAKAVANGIPSEKIIISGIPVDPEFELGKGKKPSLLTALGFDPALPTLLVVGSKRVSGISETLSALEGVSYPFQVVAIAGGDELLFEELNKHSWSFPIRIENYVTNMAEWMQCADLLITKAGGLILSEGLAAGLPMVLIDNLPGQESGNVRYVVENHAAVQVDHPQELSWLVNSWLSEDSKLLHAITANSRRLGHPQSAFEIASALWQASCECVPQPV